MGETTDKIVVTNIEHLPNVLWYKPVDMKNSPRQYDEQQQRRKKIGWLPKTCAEASENEENIREGNEEREEGSETVKTDENEGRRLQQFGGKGIHVWKGVKSPFFHFGW